MVELDEIGYEEFKTNLERTTDEVADGGDPLLIKCQNGKAVVLMSLADFKGYKETAYLLASPKNAKRLNDSIAQVESSMNPIKK